MATRDLSPRLVTYRSLAKGSGREVFKAYSQKADAAKVAYYRHNAFEGRFRRYGESWFLQITPTYRFTFDGKRVHRGYESKLKGIKAQERNPSVLGQVVMWADILRGPQEPDLFAPSPYPNLTFGDLLGFQSEVGINERLWLSTEEDAEVKDAGNRVGELLLFTRDGGDGGEARGGVA